MNLVGLALANINPLDSFPVFKTAKESRNRRL